MGKRVFITGATGFIGRRLVERLCKDGQEVVALVRRKEHNLSEKVKVVCGDILDFGSLEMAGVGCQTLYHLAAEVSFEPSKKEQLLRVNGEGTRNILQAAASWNVKQTVVVSSACTIGLSNNKNNILNEDAHSSDRLACENPYLASKLVAEEEAMRVSREQSVVIVNPSTVYGPGDWSLNSGTLVKKVAQTSVLPVPPGGGNVVDVDDIVDGILAAESHGLSGKRYILGNENLSFAQIFSTVATVIGHQPIFISVPTFMRIPMALAAGFVGRVTKSRLITPQIISDMFSYKYYSNQKAKEELKWEPRYSFEESIERAWNFYKKERII